MYDCKITLKKANYQSNNTDDYGNIMPSSYTTHDVYAEPKSISQKEFYEAAAGGFKPEIKFEIAEKSEYNGEEIAVYNSEEYRVIRTFAPSNKTTLEITCEKGIV